MAAIIGWMSHAMDGSVSRIDRPDESARMARIRHGEVTASFEGAHFDIGLMCVGLRWPESCTCSFDIKPS